MCKKGHIRKDKKCIGSAPAFRYRARHEHESNAPAFTCCTSEQDRKDPFRARAREDTFNPRGAHIHTHGEQYGIDITALHHREGEPPTSARSSTETRQNADARLQERSRGYRMTTAIEFSAE